MDGLKRTRELLTPELSAALDAFPAGEVEELRFRLGRYPTLLLRGDEQVLLPKKTDQEEILRILEKATGASLHAVSDALVGAYLNYKGVRIGVCGTVVHKNGAISAFQSYSSLALRIPHACYGICGQAAEDLAADWKNTLLLSPPGGGKTTALRELIRRLSEKGKRIAVLDDRNELSASDTSGAQFDLGPHTDVLVGAAKAEGALLLLRSMNPQILAMDEITAPEDALALEQAAGCGVGLLASAHGAVLSDLRSRPLYRQLLDSRLFQRLLLISGSGRQRRYQLLSLDG